MKITKNKLLFRALIAFSFIAVLVFIGILSWSIDVKETSQKKEEELKKELNVHVEHEDHLAKILKADQSYMEGDYREALEQYYKLFNIKEFEDQELIKFRINRIEELLNPVDTVESESEEIKAYKYTINELKVERDSIYNATDSVVSSLEKQLNTKDEEIKTLEDQIASKNKSLRKEEKIQVISFKNSKGGNIHYLGEVEDGQANGGGVGIWNTGSIYKGDWKNNKRHGEGKFEWADGHTYEGDYEDDKRSGDGTYSWPSGERYVGEWKDDKRNGQGILYDKDGNVQFDGKWIDDNIVKK